MILETIYQVSIENKSTLDKIFCLNKKAFVSPMDGACQRHAEQTCPRPPCSDKGTAKRGNFH